MSELHMDKWPEAAIADVKKQTQEISDILYTIQGQLLRKTMLPKPPDLETLAAEVKKASERDSVTRYVGY